MTAVGELALWVALFLAAWGGVASFAGAAAGRPELVASGVRAVYAAALMASLANIGVVAALLTHDFSLEYVASHTTLNTPAFYLVTALWAGPAGEMLSFALGISLCATIAMSGRRRLPADLLPWMVGALATTLTLVLVAVCFLTNPYDRVAWVPAEGAGLHPRLQNPLALPYFVATYGAYAATTVLGGLAAGAVVTRRVDAVWNAAVRRWVLVAWCLLTVSIGLRMRWTYLEPVAGGFWRPTVAEVANAVLWALSLVSLRSFAVRAAAPPPRSSAGLALSVFAVALIGAALLPRAPAPPDEAVAPTATAVLSLVGFAVVGAVTIYTSVMQLPRVATNPARPTTRPRVAGPILYVGLGILLVGLVGKRSWRDYDVSLEPGRAAELADPFARRWRFVSQGVSRDERMNHLATGVALEAWLGARRAGIISAERRQYLDTMERPTFEPALTPGIRSTAALDVYVVLTDVRGDTARLRVAFRPLVAAVWVGWMVVAVGGLALGLGGARGPGAAR